jgi:putative toxin-antitoxin system antitoxin component (TIGR02293 family)
MTSQSTLATRLRAATERTDLDRADVAQIVGTNPRTVARWLSEESEPRTDARRRLLEVLAVLEQLSGVLQPQAAHDWLFSPNPTLEHRKPVELLAEGNFRPVLGLIDALAEGVFV